MAHDPSEPILAALRDRGVRITSARRAVVSALVASDGHLTADDIAARVQRRAPDIHLSTVYRTLESLDELGVLDTVHLGHGGAVYHLVDNRHPHLVCERCRTVIHVDDGLLDTLARDIDRRYRFTLRPHHFAMVGLCESCRAAGQP